MKLIISVFNIKIVKLKTINYNLTNSLRTLNNCS